MNSADLTPEQIDECYDNIRGQVFRSVPFEDVDDMVQEAWIRVLGSLRKFKGRSSFSVWVYSVVSGAIACYHREGVELWRAYARVDNGDPGLGVTVTGQDSMLIFDELISKAEEGERALSRKAILRLFDDGKSRAEIAAELDLTWDYVRKVIWKRDEANCREANVKPRSILRDRFLYGRTHREIANKWGVTRNSIECQYKRRLGKLRSVLGGR